MSSILLIAAALLLVINVPIAFALGGGSLIAVFLDGKIPVELIVQRMFTAVDSYTLLALPLFMIAGRLMEKGGISKRLIDLAGNIVGSLPGGLGIAAILACMFFGAISGSPAATVVAIGSITVPAMIKIGYDKYFALALIASAGMLGGIIPPSIPFVTYGVTTNTSVGKLFMAGFGPGIVMGLSLMLVCYFISKKRGYIGTGSPSLKGFIHSAKEAAWGLLMPIIILGGIYGGIFTPTEAAAVSCVYGIVIGVWVYKELNWKEFITGIAEAGTTSAMVMVIIGAATAMGWIMTAEQIPVVVANALSSIAHTKFAILLLINLILLITGCIMELNASVIILAPLFMPLLKQYNIDLVHFGMIMIVNLSLGLLTPPLGMNLFIAGGLLKNSSVNKIVYSAIPFFIVLFVALTIITYVPEVSRFLPNLMNIK